MILGFISIIIELIILILIIIKIYKEYKSSNSFAEKTLFLLIILIFLYPIVLFTIDKTNLASYMGWVNENNSDRWFSYFATYGSSLVSAIIGAIALILMTMLQLKRQDDKDREAIRINNMPLLIYDISRKKGAFDISNLLLTNCKEGKTIDFEIKIQNIGMNTVKKSFMHISSKMLSSDIYEWLENNGCIKKDETVYIYRFLSLPKGISSLSITIFYCDLINNWYRQKVLIKFDIADYCDKNGSLYVPSIMVEDGELLDEEPKEKKLVK